jgi:hypothetical protein
MTSINDIEAGDVLLFRGKGLIPWAIRVFDGGEVNHAAIALDATTLGEAAALGLHRTAISGVVGRNVFTEVRRMDGIVAKPVLDRAGALLDDGNRYAYHQIILLAILGVTRRIPAPWAARRLLRSALDHAASAVGDLVPTGKTRMICSEFVFRCYAEANPTSVIDIDLATVFALEEGPLPLLDWALAQSDREVELPSIATFGSFDIDAAQRDLEQNIREYAEQAGLAGTLPEDAVVDDSVVFAAPPEPEPPLEPEDLLPSLANFGLALQYANGEVEPTFSIGAAIGTAALKGAVQGILDVSVDANFVTPRDLSKSTSLSTVGRITAG